MSALGELHSKFREESLSSITNGDSFFGEIPSEIGKIIYCDSTIISAAPDDKDIISKKRIKKALFCLILIGLICFLLRNHLIGATILSLAVFSIGLYSIVKTGEFKGVDYFVGKEGFAKMRFEKARDNIIEKNIYHFYDFTEFVTGETYKKVNFAYQGTDYFASFMGKPDDNNHVEMLVEYVGTYFQEKPEDDLLDKDYLFVKAIEDAWSRYKIQGLLDLYKTTGSYTFNILATVKNTSKLAVFPYIKFTSDSIQIGNNTYNKSTIKDMYFKQGYFIIEHINHSKKLLGLIEKGQKDEIPLTNVGNKQLFIWFLDAMIKTDMNLSSLMK